MRRVSSSMASSVRTRPLFDLNGAMAAPPGTALGTFGGAASRGSPEDPHPPTRYLRHLSHDTALTDRLRRRRARSTPRTLTVSRSPTRTTLAASRTNLVDSWET